MFLQQWKNKRHGYRNTFQTKLLKDEYFFQSEVYCLWWSKKNSASHAQIHFSNQHLLETFSIHLKLNIVKLEKRVGGSGREKVCMFITSDKGGILLRRENPTYNYWAPVAAATRGFKMVSFTASRGNNFVGGTYAPPSAFLVYPVWTK